MRSGQLLECGENTLQSIPLLTGERTVTKGRGHLEPHFELTRFSPSNSIGSPFRAPRGPIAFTEIQANGEEGAAKLIGELGVARLDGNKLRL
jgi:hypothetical protein